jgi:hypothetical protein
MSSAMTTRATACALAIMTLDVAAERNVRDSYVMTENT